MVGGAAGGGESRRRAGRPRVGGVVAGRPLVVARGPPLVVGAAGGAVWGPQEREAPPAGAGSPSFSAPSPSPGAGTEKSQPPGDFGQPAPPWPLALMSLGTERPGATIG